MVTIYVIQSINANKLYVGMTEDLDNRLKEHNAGKSKYTATYRTSFPKQQSLSNERLYYFD